MRPVAEYRELVTLEARLEGTQDWVVVALDQWARIVTLGDRERLQALQLQAAPEFRVELWEWQVVDSAMRLRWTSNPRGPLVLEVIGVSDDGRTVTLDCVEAHA